MKLGDMTPDQRATAVRKAVKQLNAELEALAPAITEILESPAPAVRVHRFCGTPVRPSTQEDMTVTPETHTDEYPWVCPHCMDLVRDSGTGMAPSTAPTK